MVIVMALQYGYDDSYDEYHFPPAHNSFDDYNYDNDGYEQYNGSSDYDNDGYEYAQHRYDEYNCYIDDDYLYNCNACSDSDCTGLVVSGEGKTDELNDYRDMYKFGKPYGINKKKNNKKY